jgi:hypothetical protein
MYVFIYNKRCRWTYRFYTCMYWKKKRCSMEVVVGRVHDVADWLMSEERRRKECGSTALKKQTGSSAEVWCVDGAKN